MFANLLNPYVEIFIQLGNLLMNSFENIWYSVMSLVPAIIFAIIIFVIGWILARLISRIVESFVDKIGLDEALRGAGVEDIFHKGGINLDSGKFLGSLSKIFIVAIFLVASFDVLQLTEVNSFLSDVVLQYIPRVAAAVLILILSAIVGQMVEKVVVTSTKAAKIKNGEIIGATARWSIWIFAILNALVQLGIGVTIIDTILNGIVAGVAIAFGIAFGIGGKENASKILSGVEDRFSK